MVEVKGKYETSMKQATITALHSRTYTLHIQCRENLRSEFHKMQFWSTLRIDRAKIQNSSPQKTLKTAPTHQERKEQRPTNNSTKKSEALESHTDCYSRAGHQF
jgi:hypothetical protein